MDGNVIFFFKIITLFVTFILIDSVPDSYCFARLNDSDCGRGATPVFYHYKPGSRCEIRMWKGCPTDNIFRNEYECSHRCIGRLFWGAGEHDGISNVKNMRGRVCGGKNTESYKPHWCQKDLNHQQCNKEEAVYTYDLKTKTCMSKKWYGCPSDNKFQTFSQCKRICIDGIKRFATNYFNDELKQILDEVANKINEVTTTKKPTLTTIDNQLTMRSWDKLKGTDETTTPLSPSSTTLSPSPKTVSPATTTVSLSPTSVSPLPTTLPEPTTHFKSSSTDGEFTFHSTMFSE